MGTTEIYSPREKQDLAARQELEKKLRAAAQEGNIAEVNRIVGEMTRLSNQAAPVAVLVNITELTWLAHRTYGIFQIPGCIPGQPYSTLPIRARTGKIDMGDNKSFEFPITAREIAEDLAREVNTDAGEGSYLGVFVCWGEQPTAEELTLAHKNLESYYKAQVAVADSEWERAHNRQMISDVARRACRWLKLERDYSADVVAQQICPACGERLRPGVAVCRTCGAVLDRAKAEQYGLTAPAEPEAAPAAKGRAAGKAAQKG